MSRKALRRERGSPGSASLGGRTASPLPGLGGAAIGWALPTCLRCGFEVAALPRGCKHPCQNCGFIYPLGDCSD